MMKAKSHFYLKVFFLSSLMIKTVNSFSIPMSTVTNYHVQFQFTTKPIVIHNIAKNSKITRTQLNINRIPIDENFKNIQLVHSNPDIYIIKDFLDKNSCADIIERAKKKSLSQSPVAYAGWTQDLKELLELAAKGPVAWLAIIGAWFQLRDDASANQVELVIHALQNYAVLLVIAAASIALFTKSRADGLQALRTSTSTTLDDLSDNNSGTTKFVARSAQLFDPSINYEDKDLIQQARLFEAPTVIRYESGQLLAPHYDANRSADTEDANRGGQTLATLLLYLNDVKEGGLTRFGKLPAINPTKDEKALTVQPRIGDALLFFPADQYGRFDERLEHEGCPALDEKWIARIWRHMDRVPPPFGLSEASLQNLSS